MVEQRLKNATLIRGQSWIEIFFFKRGIACYEGSIMEIIEWIRVDLLCVVSELSSFANLHSASISRKEEADTSVGQGSSVEMSRISSEKPRSKCIPNPRSYSAQDHPVEGHDGSLSMYAPQAFLLDVSVQERSSRRSRNARSLSVYKGTESGYLHPSADQSRKPKRNFVLIAYILTQHIIYIYSYIYIFIYYIYISSLRSFSLCISLFLVRK